MARVSLEDFMKGMVSATTGQIAGHLAGQQQAEARDLQQFQNALQFAQLGGQEQDRRNALLTSQLPSLTPASAAQAVTDIVAQPSALAPLAGHPFVQRHPEYAPFFAQKPAVPVAPAPAGGQPSAVVGGKQYTYKGITKEQIAQRGAQIKAARELLRNQVGAITDPTVKAHAGGILADLDASDITTPEGYDRAGQALQRADAAGYTSLGAQGAQQRQAKDIQGQFETEIEKDLGSLNGQALISALPGHLQTERWIREQRGKAGYGGKGLEGFAKEIEALPELAKSDPAKAEQQAEMIRRAIAAKKSPAEMSKNVGTFYKLLSGIAPTQRTPEVVRQLAQNTGVDSLLTGLDDEGLLLGGAAAEKAYQDFLKRMSTQNFAGMSKEAQAGMIQEATTLAGYLGRKVSLPAEFVAKMTPWQQAQVGMQKDRLAISGDLRDIVRANLGISQARLGLDERKFKEAQKQNKISPTDMQTIQAKRKAVDDAREQLKTTLERLPVLPGNVDLDNPKPGAETLYADLIKKLHETEDDYVGFMGTLGIPVAPVTDVGYKPAPAAPPVKTERKTILGIPYGPEVPVEGGQPGTLQGAAQAVPAATAQRVNYGQALRFSNAGQQAAKEALKQGTSPFAHNALALIQSKSGADWEGWVNSLPPAKQQQAWTAYWYLKFRKPSHGSSGTAPKR
jgi:hypothetical protein